MAKQTKSCNQCEWAYINGVFCHETECPNSHKVWIDGMWLPAYKCDICGYDVIYGETCDCYLSGESFPLEPESN